MANGSGWRARVEVAGRKKQGPQRETRAAAQADLEAARRCSSRDEMVQFLQLQATADPEAPGSEHDDDDDDVATAAKCDRMEAFLQANGRPPRRRALDPEERKLRKIWDDLVRRLTGPIGDGVKPSERKLRHPVRAKVELVQRVICRLGQSQPSTAAFPLGEGESLPSTADVPQKRLRKKSKPPATRAETL